MTPRIRAGRIAAAMAVAAGTVTALAAPVNAVPAPGRPEGAVVIGAHNLGMCRAAFDIVNRTNVTSYTIDWRVDGEPGRTIDGVPFPIWRTGGMSAKAASPTWPDEVPANTVENRTMVSDRKPVRARYVQNLNRPTGSWNPKIRPRWAHRVDYRLVLGPPGNNGQTPTEKPEWIGDRQWRSIVVTGCGPLSRMNWGS